MFDFEPSQGFLDWFAAETERHEAEANMKKCLNCKKRVHKWLNFCSWDCHVELAKKDGGKLHTPNGLPVRCITCDNVMLECEHGDHPTYMFPVEVEFTGRREPVLDEGYDPYANETHALIYTDGTVALTLHEAQYFLWHLTNWERPKMLGGSDAYPVELKLTDESVEKIKQRLEKR